MPERAHAALLARPPVESERAPDCLDASIRRKYAYQFPGECRAAPPRYPALPISILAAIYAYFRTKFHLDFEYYTARRASVEGVRGGQE
jgi:hypothetical protein